MPTNSLLLNLYQQQMIKFGDFVLKSGKHSPIYINLREMISYPSLLTAIADSMWEVLPKASHPQRICGVPYSALTLATYLSIKHNVPMLLRRKEAKTYGTKQQIEGVYQAQDTCLIIEDVVTSGQSILETVHDLRAAGLHIDEVICFVDREQGAREHLLQHGIRLHAVWRLRDILTYLGTEGLISPDEIQRIQQALNKD